MWEEIYWQSLLYQYVLYQYVLINCRARAELLQQLTL